jgi:hypothetical protein
MRPDVHPTESPRANDRNASSKSEEDSLWAFLPILVALATICLLMYFLLPPRFEAADPVGAKSARPGAAISVTVQQEKGNP